MKMKRAPKNVIIKRLKTKVRDVNLKTERRKKAQGNHGYNTSIFPQRPWELEENVFKAFKEGTASVNQHPVTSDNSFQKQE